MQMLKMLILETPLILININANYIVIKKKIKNFNKKISVSGDKSISIRWVFFHHCIGHFKSSEFTYVRRCLAALEAIKKIRH